jgi:hypothetical protein
VLRGIAASFRSSKRLGDQRVELSVNAVVEVEFRRVRRRDFVSSHCVSLLHAMKAYESNPVRRVYCDAQLEGKVRYRIGQFVLLDHWHR